MDGDLVKGAMVGMVLGDAYCMPVHWYYDVELLSRDYGSELDEVVAPKRIHPESMVAGMSYGGTLDILHDKAPLYEGNISSKFQLSKEEIAKRTDKHGNFVGKTEDERIHYHVSLCRGQNTANVAIARLLMRTLAEVNSAKRDGYSPEGFLEAMKAYMLTKPEEGDAAQLANHNDTYLDVWVRRFFEAASAGTPLLQCACNQRDVWSIGSLDGVVMALPTMAAYRHDAEAVMLARAIEQHMLTHRSVTVTAGVTVVAPLLQQLWRGDEPDAALDKAMDKIRPPKITGPEMRHSYVSSSGPGKIPKQEKWAQHMEPSRDGQSLRALVHEMLEHGIPITDVAGWLPAHGNARFATACYVEHALSIVLYLAVKHKNDYQGALKENAMLGGHTTSRGAILGAIIGARVGFSNLPQAWVSQLAAPDQVAMEAEGIVGCALTWQ